MSYPGRICPADTQDLVGKRLRVGIIGLPPLVTGFGRGADFVLFEMLAEKFGFSFVYRKAAVFNFVTLKNGTRIGQVYRVSYSCCKQR